MSSILAAFTEHFPELYEEEPSAQSQSDEQTQPGQLQPTEQQHDAATDPYRSKVTTITKQFDATRTSADELHAYLQLAEQQAQEAEQKALEEADQAFTPAWRNTGLPMKPSHLALDASRMAAARLVNPKAIMAQYTEVKSKEQLHPPHTYEYNDTSIQPNYLNSTANLESRRKRALPDSTLERVRTTYLKERDWPHLTEDEVAGRIAESEARRRQQDQTMPPTQYDAEKKVIASMHHKLNFLRNPRYPLPPSVKLLQSQFQPGPTWGSAKTTAFGDSAAYKHPPIKSNMTAKPDLVFLVEPSEALFENYEVGKVYSKTLNIRNVTQVIRSMRLFPPASQYFHVSMPRLPTDTSSIAPGMAAQVTVRFTPDSLADYDDEFAVDTATSRFTVALKARRPPPKLTLAQEMHIGEVLCGNRKVQQFPFTNKGGHGRFRITPASYWPDDYASAPLDMAVVGPFEVWPLYYDLAPGEEVVLNVAFEPKTMGLHTERLVMVCDNCQVKEFSIKGLASDVDVQLESIDCIPLSSPISSSSQEGSTSGSGSLSARRRQAPPQDQAQTVSEALLDAPLWFGEVVPGSTFCRRVAVRNTTTLPFPFKWQWSSKPKTRAPRALNQPGPYPLDPDDLRSYQEHSRVTLSATDPNTKSLSEVGRLSMGTFGGATDPGPRRGVADKGEVDLVALGLEAGQAPFEVTPSEGVLQPGELMEFALHFGPPALDRYLRWAQLLVDKAPPGAGPSTCDTTVLELGMEGVAAPLNYELTPRLVSVAGVLTPGEVVTRSVTLTNRTRAPANFDFQGADDCVTVTPSQGVIPPLGNTHVTVSFTAGEDVGRVHRTLQCQVMHGHVSPLEVVAEVGHPQLELLTKRLDFGLVRLNGSETRTLRFRNSSATCPTNWQLEECVQSHRAAGGAEQPLSEQVNPTYLQFWPASGSLGPNEEMEVHVVCHGLSDGQHHSIVKLTSPGGPLNCLEAFAAVVTPRAVVSRPKVDMGAAFLGVTTRFSFTLKNLALLPLVFSWKSEGRPVTEGPQGQLSEKLPADMKIRPETGMLHPGEELELQVWFTPQVVGPIVMYGVCDVEGAPLPTGFMATCNARGLDVTYDVLTPEQYHRWSASLKDPRIRRRRDDVDNFQGLTHLSPEVLARLGNSRLAQANPGPDPRHHVADFGAAVPLGDIRSLYVVVTNRTPIASSLNTWLDCFGVDDVDKLRGGKSKGKHAAAGSKALYGRTQAEAPVPESPAMSSTRSTRHAPFKLLNTEKIKPFTSSVGNSMMETRRQQQGSASALGNKGLAVSVSPPDSQLPPWGRAVLVLSAFNDMCGDYFDILHVKVGDLPEKRVPVRIGVSGTPLVVQKERVLLAGLHDRASQWHTDLCWGQLPTKVKLQKTFYVFNTGSLDMHLSWKFYRYQDDDDCQRPDTKLFDVKLEVVHSHTDDGLLLGMGDEGPLRSPSAAGAGLARGVSGAVNSLTRQDSGGPSRMRSQLGGPSSAYLATRPSMAALGLANVSSDLDQTESGGMRQSAFAMMSSRPSMLLPAVSGRPSALMLSEPSMFPAQSLGLDESLMHTMSEAQEVRLILSRHAEPDSQPFVVEPSDIVIRGGAFARFVVYFESDRPLEHLGYLLGEQKVISREGPISLKIWPCGDLGQEVGAMFSGTFHEFAGQPPAPLKPLWVDLSATTAVSYLEPDARSELSFSLCSTLPPSHASYKHTATLSNNQSSPLIFSLRVEGPFELTSAVPSAPQDVTLYRGTTGISEGLPVCGQPMQPASWLPGQTYLPPKDSINVDIQFTPPPTDHRDDYELQGALIVEYANGDVQRLPLSAHVMHPALELRHAQQLRPPSASRQAPEHHDTGDPPQGSEGVSPEPSGSDGQQGASDATQDLDEATPQLEQPIPRDVMAPLNFGRVHVQRPKPLEITLLNPTLVDAVWAASSADQAPKYCSEQELSRAAYSEVQIGPFIIKPAFGSLGGRGIKLPRTQRITVTFSPPDNKTYVQRVLFGARKGRPVELVLAGSGSYDETEEHQRILFQVYFSRVDFHSGCWRLLEDVVTEFDGSRRTA